MQAILILEDGTVFHGKPIGVTGQTIGEVVFNTSMTGYQEILTDPSYKEQIVTLTSSHIGNTGINSFDEESSNLHLKGLIIKELAETYSDYRATESLSDYLKRNSIVGIHDIDTRKLTHLLREKGAQKGGILCQELITQSLIEDFLLAIKQSNGLEGRDLAKEVTCEKSYTYFKDFAPCESNSSLNSSNTSKFSKSSSTSQESIINDSKYKVVVYDFGVKKNILNLLFEKGCEVVVVPATTAVEEVLALNPGGILLSNGPGDPAACDYAIESTKSLLSKNLPIMGICLGHQILALASGAKTQKMKFGHHGANHPVKNLLDNSVAISVQNHGFTVDKDTLPSHIDITHISLFDGSIQGIKLKDKPAFGFQGHPEASPGPTELSVLFDLFIQEINKKQPINPLIESLMIKQSVKTAIQQ